MNELTEWLMKETICEMEECTDNNEHTESVVLMAKWLNDDLYISMINNIKREANRLGYMTMELVDDRQRLVTKILNKIEEQFGLEVRNKFYRAM